jgi:hypothetical protein
VPGSVETHLGRPILGEILSGDDTRPVSHMADNYMVGCEHKYHFYIGSL